MNKDISFLTRDNIPNLASIRLALKFQGHSGFEPLLVSSEINIQHTKVPQNKLFRLFAIALLFVLFSFNPSLLFARTYSSMTIGTQSGTLTYGTSGSATFLVTWKTTSGGNLSSGTFSVSGLPSGATGSFSPASVTANNATQNPTTTLTVTSSASSPAGSYSITVDDGLTHTVTGTLTISQAALSVDANNVSKTYGTALTGGSGSTAFTSIGLKNGETIGSVTIAYGTGSLATAAVNTYVGTVTASAATGGTFTASNYTITYTSGDITVSAAPLTITANDVTKTYGTALTGGSGSTSFTSTGLQNGQTIGSVTIAYGTGAAANAAATTYLLSVTASAATGGTFNASNYSITYIQGVIIVNPAALTITGVTASNKSYDGLTTATLSGTAAYSGLKNGESFAVTGTPSAAFATAAVGTAKVVTVTGYTAPSSNYTVTQPSLSANITARALTVTASDVTKTYGTALSGGAGSVSFTSSGLQNGETIGSVTIAYGTGSLATAAAGTYTLAVTPSAATGGTFTASNYTITYAKGSIIVNPASLAITANDVTKTYGTALTGGSGSTSFTSTGLQNGQTIGSVTIAYGTGAAANAAATTYLLSVTPSAATGGTFTASNYSITYVQGDIIVNPAALTITGVTASNKAYDGLTNATLTGTAAYSGLKNGESFTVSGTPVATFASATVGTSKPVSVTGYTAPNANYTLTQPSLTANITARALTVTADDVTKTYGTALTGGSGSAAFTTIGLQNGETIGSVTIVYGTGAAANAAATTYLNTVTPSAATGGTFTTSNYAITYATGDIIVNQATLTITGISVDTKPYDGLTTASLLGTAAYSGLKNGESFSVTGTPVATFSSAAVGTGKPVTVTGYTAPSSNYTVTQPSLTGTITGRTLTVTATDVTKTYGTVLTGGAGSVSFTASGLQNGETIGSVTIAYGTGSAATASAGTYSGSVTASAATGGTFSASNYSITYQAGSITVTKYALSVTANSTWMCQGSSLTFAGTEFTTSGLLNTDNVTSVSLASTGANASALPGTYSITASGATGSGLGNYTITYFPGTLTVRSRPTVSNVVPASVCGPGSLILGATASAGTINWYTASTGGTAVATGASYTTPVISVTTIYYTDATSNGCTTAARTAVTATVNRDGYWTGSAGNDWNNAANWECGQLPGLTTDVTLPAGAGTITVSAPNTAMVRNLAVGSGTVLTVNGTLQVTGSMTSSGTLNAQSGTLEMKGSSAQTIPASLFSSNKLMNLTINNAAGVTLAGALNVLGIVTPSQGTLQSGGFLTLVSNSGQTALISGSGSGQVTGTVNMQRYIASAYGYKYLSSPFSDATCAQLTPYLSTTSTLSKIYSYDENHRNGATAITGWTACSSSAPLSVMQGYAVNLGSDAVAKTVSLSGTVNNGTVSGTLYNHNGDFTKGFNLVGNPYPSPIDWYAVSGWTKSNIDDGIYFFDSSGAADEYSGTYSSFVNGISSGGSTNIIAAMQGFFVHVSSGAYPVTATLGMNNQVRTSQLNPVFKSATTDLRTVLRFNASFEGTPAASDHYVLYFDPAGTPAFDASCDALKILNTDAGTPNLYSITTDASQLQINGMPQPGEQGATVPLGIRTFRDGMVSLEATDLSRLPAGLKLYLFDSEKKTYQDLASNPSYRVNLKSGEYNQRFSLVFSWKEIQDVQPTQDKLFFISHTAGKYLVNINLAPGGSGRLWVTNLLGQRIQELPAYGGESIELNTAGREGIFIVTLVTSGSSYSEKTIVRKDL